MTARPIPASAADSEFERRARIRARLQQLGEGPAALFADICLLLDDDRGLKARPMLLSHLVRELESSVREVLLPRRTDTVDEAAEPTPAEPPLLTALRLLGEEVLRALGLKSEAPENEEKAQESAGSTHRREIAEVLTSLGIDPDGPVGKAWRKVAGDQAALAHRSNLAAPQLRESRVTEHVGRAMAVLDEVLDAFDARFLDLVDRLEALASTPAPTKKDAARLLKEFPQDLVTSERFFDGLVDPAWLGPLNGAKLFSAPPAPEVDREAGRVSFVRWPASAYLARVAADDPGAALQVARDIPATENPFVHLDLVAVAAAVPSDKAGQLLPTLTRALAAPYLLLPSRYADLALHLAGQQQPDAAAELLTALLAAGFGPDAKLGEADSGHLLQTYNDDFADRLGTRWVHLLTDTLAGSLGTTAQAAQRRSMDASAFWFPLIADTPDIVHASPQSRLAVAIRDAADRLIAADPETAADILTLLQAQPWAVFRRLRLYLITRHPDVLAKDAAAALADPALREDLAAEREWLALAAAFAERLTDEQQQALLAAVDEGPDTARWSADQEQRTGHPVEPERLKAVADLWQRDRLTALTPIIGPEQRQRLADLETTYGTARPVDEPLIRFTPIVTTPPEAELGQLAGLSAAELVERVTAWEPQPTGFGGTNQHALAGRLREVVAAQGARYSAEAAAFTAVEDLYLLQILHGFQDAARREAIDWAGPLALAGEAVRRTGTALAHELHREAVNLVGRAVTHPINPAEPAYADTLWSLITTVIASNDTPDPVPEPGAYLDDARAQGLRAAVDWATWRRQANADTSPLLRLLDALLDDIPLPGADGPQVQAAALGGLLPQLAYLDSTWAGDRATALLSTGAHADDAWNAYLAAPLFGPAASPVLDLYRAHAARPEAADDRSARQRLALGRHLLGLHLGGHFALDGEDSPIPDYYRGSSTTVLKQLATLLGAGTPNLSDQALPRVQAWWTWRLAAVTSATEPDGRTELIDTLPALAASGRFPEDWTLQQFRALLNASGELRTDSTTFTYLTRAADAHTEQVLLLLKDWITTLGPYDQMPRYREADIRALLRTGLDDPKQSQLAEEIINRAASRGHSQFRGLLHVPAEDREQAPDLDREDG